MDGLQALVPQNTTADGEWLTYTSKGQTNIRRQTQRQHAQKVYLSTFLDSNFLYLSHNWLHEEDTFLKTDTSSASQLILRILWNRYFHYLFTMTRHLSPSGAR